jgi:aspartokinase-like uncharacterized kinase
VSRCRVCVAKFGGSLLSRPDLRMQLRKWLAIERATHGDSHFVLVVGGGKLADAIRKIDGTSPLGEANAHWICVDLMSITARIVGAMIPELTIVDQFQQLVDRVVEPGTTLFCPNEFLRQIEPTREGTRLPADWSVTSDAIAARLAIVLGADELVLVKTVAPPISRSAGDNWNNELAALGFVDAFLPSLAHELPAIRFAVLNEPKLER